ncbi:MAG: asparaginase [Synergistaceae bacterium]|nr:asparaginase [Synergistaceae bacterium]
MKIAMLSTGGTISSVMTDRGLAPEDLNVERLVKICPALMGFEHEIDFISVMNKDSSNITPQDWLVMADKIKSVEADAVILLHGTDTLAYTAAALAYLLNDLNVPVIVTGSMLAPDEFNSDAGDNIYEALQFAMQLAMYKRKGVYVSFGGILIHGLRAHKADSKHKHAFISVDYPVLGEMKDKGEYKTAWLNAKVPEFNSARPWMSLAALLASPVRIEDLNGLQIVACKAGGSRRLTEGCNNAKIIDLVIFPGMSGELINKVCNAKPDAIILEAYGLGGVCEDLLNAVKNCVANNIKVIVRSQALFGGVDLSVYEVGRRLTDAGAMPALVATREALIAKLTLLFASGSFNINNLNLNICDDI